ncbi:MAG: hypothetical protein JWN23_2034 [Rhodocyclales bacterium]|nr:hypothetical protein [Rhodocyclales bacterium]
MSRIHLLVPDMPDHTEILPYLREIDDSRRYANFGPLASRFEDQLGGMLGGPALHRCCVANCTLGLELALLALDLPLGSKVLLPALTFVATATAVIRTGLIPVLADVDPETWLLNTSMTREIIREHKIACVIPVAAYGCPVPIQQWDEFVFDTGIPVLIDAAGAFGNQQIGEQATVVFSFHATKTLGIGEGGLVCGKSKPFIEIVRRLTNFGIDISTGFSMAAGSNAKLSEYHAAVGLAAIQSWPTKAAQRRTLYTEYVKALSLACPQIKFQCRPGDGVYSIMQICLPDKVENSIVAAAMAMQDIETRLWYLPLLDTHPAFKAVSIEGGLPVARSLAKSMLGLPFHLRLAPGSIKKICSALADVLTKYK